MCGQGETTALVTKRVENQFFQFISATERAIRMQITFFKSACISASHDMKITISRDLFIVIYNNKQVHL